MKVAFWAVVMLSPLMALAQGKSLTSEEFFPLVNKAGDATYSVPYRSVTTNRQFEDDKATTDFVQTKEALNRGTSRLVQKKGQEVIEVVSIGRKNYQRENGGQWREVGTPENVYLFRTIGGTYTSEYYSGEVIRNGVKYEVLTWYVKELSGRFSENKTYIAPNGKISREEARGGTLKPATVDWDEVVEYEYNPGPMKIAAPRVPKLRAAASGQKPSTR